jgi:type IV fimbrial biogenesis protein FimT
VHHTPVRPSGRRRRASAASPARRARGDDGGMKNRSAGFTLFELMIGIGIMGILLAMAVPSFQEYGRNTRVLAFNNDLITAFNYARNEAIRQGTPVTVCASSNFTGCAGSVAGFQTGWIVFTDAVGAVGTVNVGDTILQMWEAQDMSGLTISASSRWVQFTPTGLASPVTTNKTYTVRSMTCPTGQPLVRSVNVNGIGAIRAERTAC